MSRVIKQLINDLSVSSASLREAPLLKFHGTTISFSDASHNVLVMGGTGSGKTNALRNAIAELVHSGCPGLILDVKGDYKKYLLDIAPDRTVFVGATKDCLPVNLIGGMSCEKFLSFLQNEIASMYTEKFWGTGGVRDAELLFRYMSEASEPTLALLFDMLLMPEVHVPKLVEYLTSKKYLNESLLRSFQGSRMSPFGIIRRAAASGPEHAKVFEQYEWHTAGILSALKNFSHNPNVRQKLSAGKCLDIASLIYGENKIVVLDMPITKYGSLAYTVARLLRQQLVDAIFSSSSGSLSDKGFGYSKFSFLLIDEYQQYMNVVRRNNASGIYDDNLILDKTRQYGHINLLATQGVSSLLAQADEHAVSSLMQNCRTQVIFSSNDIQTLVHAEKLSREEDIATQLLKPEKKGVAYVYSAHATVKGGGAISGMYRCPQNRWFADSDFATIDDVSAEVLNPFYKQERNPVDTGKSIESEPHTGKIIICSDCIKSAALFNKYLETNLVNSVYSVKHEVFGSELQVAAHIKRLDALATSKGDALCFMLSSERNLISLLAQDDSFRQFVSQLKARGVILYGVCRDPLPRPVQRLLDCVVGEFATLAKLLTERIKKSDAQKQIDQRKHDHTVFLVSTGEKAEAEFFSVYDAGRNGEIGCSQIFRVKPETSCEQVAEWLSTCKFKSRDKICFIREHASEIPVRFFESEKLAENVKRLSASVDILAGLNSANVLARVVRIECVTPQEVGHVLNNWDEITNRPAAG